LTAAAKIHRFREFREFVIFVQLCTLSADIHFMFQTHSFD